MGVGTSEEGSRNVAGEEVAEDLGSNVGLKLGVAFVIGAIAANVFGARYSRQAVGRELYRGWVRRESRRAQKANEKAERSSFWDGGGPAGRGTQSSWRSGQSQRKTTGNNSQHQRPETTEEMFERLLQEELRKLRQDNNSQRTTGFGPNTEYFRYYARQETGGRSAEEMMRKMMEEMGRSGHHNARGFGFHSSSAEEFARMFGSGSFGNERASGRRAPQTPKAGYRDHYSTLGVQPGSSQAEIRKKFREKAKKWHPDSYTGPDPEGAAIEFRKISEAYQALRRS